MLRNEGADKLDLVHNFQDHDTRQHWSHYDIEYAMKGFGFAFFDVDVIEIKDKYDNNKKTRYIQVFFLFFFYIKLND